MMQPMSGGSYSRDPRTGALTLITPATAWVAPQVAPAEPATSGDIDNTETPAGPGKKGK